MDKNSKHNNAIVTEINELEMKIRDLKRGYESTIHDFAKSTHLYNNRQ